MVRSVQGCLYLALLAFALLSASAFGSADEKSSCEPSVRKFNVPLYPLLARQMKVEGTVTTVVELDQHGEIAKVEKVSGPPPLVPTVESAIRGWTFRPCDAASRLTMNFHFRLVAPKSEHNIAVSVSGDLPNSVEIVARLPEDPGPDVAPNTSPRTK